MNQPKSRTFSNFDCYGLESFADKLTAYLQIESKFVDESFVLSLNSEFGSGKSTFFEMWINKLESTSKIFKVLYINAWETDFQGDSLLAIVSSLLSIVQPGKEAEPIMETAGKLCKFALSIGNDVVQKFSGIDFIKAGQYAEPDVSKDREKLGHACFQLFQQRQQLFEDLRRMLYELVQKSEQPILIIIDELDRCRPNHAVEYLETIKHFFDIHGLIFVIGVDKSQLSSSAKALFGHDLVFDEYYRKFVQRDVSLPVKSKPMTENFCRKLVEEYFSSEAFKRKGRYAFAQHDNQNTEILIELFIAFSMTARQIHEFFRILAHLFSVAKKSDSQLRKDWQVGAFFMTILSIKNRVLFDKIGNRSISLSEFTSFLLPKKVLFLDNCNRNPFWWVALLYLGIFSDRPFNQLEKEFQKLGVWPSTSTPDDFQNELNRVISAYTHRKPEPYYSHIYRCIEELKTFAE